MATVTYPAERIRAGDVVTLPDGLTGYVVAITRRTWRVTFALRVNATQSRIVTLSTVDPVEVHCTADPS